MKKLEVGHFEKKKVTPLNKELYLKAVDILEDSQHLSHIGWSGVGKFVDWLEENYNISKK
ncbi:hypothetical protein [Vibrio phage LP.2]|nr:hypothetical protein [Vibrio phage LP.2]